MENNLKEKVSENFQLSDFVECSDTYRQVPVSNIPKEPQTILFIKRIANDILEPCKAQFGNLQITYGFCGAELAKKIDGNISPKLDQHAGYEVNSKGNRICERGGFAADFHCLPISSHEVACFITENLTFDRLYFYGEHRPLHVSINEKNLGQIIVMQKKTLRVVPRKISSEAFQKKEYL